MRCDDGLCPEGYQCRDFERGGARIPACLPADDPVDFCEERREEAQRELCDNIMCDEGTVCSAGQCVDCIGNDDCDANQICRNNECIAEPGTDRVASDWGAEGGDEPNCEGNDDCTEDELCFEGNALFDSVCYMPCGGEENLAARAHLSAAIGVVASPSAHPDSRRWRTLFCR